MAREFSPSASPAPQGADILPEDVCYETIVTMQSLWSQIQCYSFYLHAIRKHAEIVKHSENLFDEKLNRQMLNRLECIEAMLILLSIYLHSSFVNERERSVVSIVLPPGRKQEIVATRHALRTTLVTELDADDSEEALRQQATRIVEAAIHFGFAEEDDHPNCKPVRGTLRLHALMRDAGRPAATLVHDALKNRA